LSRDHLLRYLHVRIRRIQPPRRAQERLDLCQAEQRIGVDRWAHQHPVRPGLGDNRIGLDPIEDFLSLITDFLHLFGHTCGGQRLVCSLQFLMQLIHFRLQSHKFLTGILVLSQGGNRLDDLVSVHLRGQVNVNDDRIAVEACAHLLVEHQDRTSRVRSNLVFGDVQVRHHCDAFQIRGHLLEGVALGRFCRQADRIFPCVPVPHPVFALNGHSPHLCARRFDKEGREKKTH
jgi:hypothetical protein